MQRSTRQLCVSLVLAIVLVATASRAASAQVAIDGGFFGVNGTTPAGAALSLSVFKLPAVPFSVDLTGAAPLNGHGFAATADGRLNLAGTTLGAGVGVGTLANTANTGVIFDGIIARTIAPHLAVEGRVYLGPNRPSSVFAGLRLSL
jgi:hypothetical protein